MLKIPFGKHKVTGAFFDAGSVPNGKGCNCLCKECGMDLEAVHPKLPNRQNYFRHVATQNCNGGLESLFHLVAKQILKENASLCIAENNIFSYTQCDLEMPRHGKQPDAFISNESESLVVEIFFWHRIESITLDAYLKNGDRVLEIDISNQRRNIFNYEYLKELILYKAKRKLFTQLLLQPKNEITNNGSEWVAAFILIVGSILFWKFRNRKPKKWRR